MNEEDVRLPQKLMRVLPENPHEQLDLARKIASMALATRVSEMEARVGGLRQNLHERDNVIEDLQRRIAEADQAIQRANIRILKTTDDQIRLSKENEVLQGTISKLKHDVSKMDSFRKTLVQTLQLGNIIEDVSPMSPIQLAPGGIKIKPSMPVNDSPRSPLVKSRSSQAEDDLSVSQAQHSDDDSPFKTRRVRKSMSEFALLNHAPVHSNDPFVSDAPIMTLPPKMSPPRSPSRSPPKVSPPKSRSAAGSPTKRRLSAATSPVIPYYQFPSQASTAPNSPPRSQSLKMSKVDGKEFFRQAKSRLPYDKFRALLNAIKDLNAHKHTREDALKKAEEIFGTDHHDLYMFLCQHLHS